ncbi:MAG: hypothetical protein IJB74_03995 [Clostridia bacterium]|nr:hypothetical protein [Clostridia bacterium]
MKRTISFILCAVFICSVMICITYAETSPLEIFTKESKTFSVTEIDMDTGKETVRTFDKIVSSQLNEMETFDLPESKFMSSRSVMGSDERIKVEDTTVYPHSAIVLLEIDWGGIIPTYATGFMISENVAVTSAHALYKRNNGFAEEVKIYPAKDGFGAWNNPYGTTVAKAMGVCTEWVDFIDNNANIYATFHDGDWGAVILDEPLGRETGIISLKCPTDSELETAKTKSIIKLCGYPGDLHLLPYYQYMSTGNVYEYMDELIYYMLDSEGGQSGSPILDENNTAIGIHCGGDPNEQSFNFAVRMDENMLYYYNLAIEDYKVS